MNKVNLFLLAAPRCGSTQVANWLNSHEDVRLSSIKEPNYFSSQDFRPSYVERSRLNDIDPVAYCRWNRKTKHQFAIFRERGHYDYLFRDLSVKWRMDASTSYLHSEEAPLRVRDYNPEARLIILLRDPASRSLSHYGLALRTGRSVLSFKDELERELCGDTPYEERFILRPSRYFEALTRWYRLFPLSQIRVIFFEDVIKSPAQELAGICDWLDISPSKIDITVNEQNASALPRFPRLNKWALDSGFKTAMRAVLPQKAKRLAKRYYFDAGKAAFIPSEDRERVAAILREDAERLRSMDTPWASIGDRTSRWPIFSDKVL